MLIITDLLFQFSQVGNVTVPDARVLQIAPWEPNMIKEVIKAINMADIGINPTTDGKVIRLVFPELTEEQYAKMAEAARKKREERRKPIVSLRIDPDTLKKAKATGKGYTGFLSRLLDNAINDPEIVKKSL